jgi:catechol 2,3-dioxygenase-like lactoylglutathione lyase family enzyme
MLCVGDIHLYVSELPTALRFWGDGLGLTLAEKEVSPNSFFARLDFPDGGPSLRLFGPVTPWPPGARPPYGTRPTVRFDVTTDDFDGVLVRLIECGGEKVDEIDVFNGLRTVTIADPDENTFELLELV